MGATSAVLVGGAPGSGKTTLARALAVDLGWTWLSGDDLAVAARALSSPEQRPELHPMAGGGSVAYFTDGPRERLVDDSLALGDALWPAFRRVIQAHSNDDPIVIDYWLFSPERIASEALDGVSSVWLNIAPEALWERERALEDYYGASTHPEDMLANFMYRALWRNSLIHEQAVAAGLPVLDQPGSRDVSDLVAEVRQVLKLD